MFKRPFTNFANALVPSCHLVCTGRQPRPWRSSSSCCAGAWTRHTDQSELSTVLPSTNHSSPRPAPGPGRCSPRPRRRAAARTVRPRSRGQGLYSPRPRGTGTPGPWGRRRGRGSCSPSHRRSLDTSSIFTPWSPSPPPTDGVAVAADVPELHRPQRVVGPGQLQRGHLGPGHWLHRHWTLWR